MFANELNRIICLGNIKGKRVKSPVASIDEAHIFNFDKHSIFLL